MHVDMDAFFASVEQLDAPQLRGKCLVVGGSSPRGVVAAASYEARKYGIHSAMPMYKARQKCSDLVIVPPRRKRYSELSHRIMAILGSFSPLVEPLSIDEAYADVTGCSRLYGTADQIGVAVKTKIQEETRLTCSVGIAPNKFLAKIASDYHKPDGLTVIQPDQMAAFIETLPIGKVPGVGAKARQKLLAMGIETLGAVNHLDRRTLVRHFGKFGHRLHQLARGIDDSPVSPDGPAKSVSSEITLEHNTRDRQILERHLLAQAQTVARQLRKHQVVARVVTLKIKTADFKRHTRSQTLARPVRSSDSLYRIAAALLASQTLSEPVRLIGLAAAGLQPETMPVQQNLFDTVGNRQHGKWEKVDRAMDEVTQRYGHRFVVRGESTDRGAKEE